MPRLRDGLVLIEAPALEAAEAFIAEAATRYPPATAFVAVYAGTGDGPPSIVASGRRAIDNLIRVDEEMIMPCGAGPAWSEAMAMARASRVLREGASQ